MGKDNSVRIKRLAMWGLKNGSRNERFCMRPYGAQLAIPNHAFLKVIHLSGYSFCTRFKFLRNRYLTFYSNNTIEYMRQTGRLPEAK